jgi:hypothetical protein
VVAPGCHGNKVDDRRSSRRRVGRSPATDPPSPAAAPLRGLDEPSRPRSAISRAATASFFPSGCWRGSTPTRLLLPHVQPPLYFPRRMPSRREAMQFCFSSLLVRQFTFKDTLPIEGCARRAHLLAGGKILLPPAVGLNLRPTFFHLYLIIMEFSLWNGNRASIVSKRYDKLLVRVGCLRISMKCTVIK